MKKIASEKRLCTMNKAVLCSLMLLCLMGCSQKKVYLFTYFTGQTEGLKLAYSYDGLNWENVSDSAFLKPEVGSKLMRDPSVVEGPDGTYHLVWTTGWEDQCIGYASTKDFKHWSEQQQIDVMADYPDTKNTWAPEITYDKTEKCYYIYWASRSDKPDDDFKIYYVKTKDFKEYTPTDVFYYTGFNLIDATLLKDKTGKGWFFFLKDGSKKPAEDKYIRFVKVEGELKDGIKGELSDPVNPGDFWSEGPAAFYVDDTIYVYYDRYLDGFFGATKSTDGGKTWTDVSDQISLPDNAWHGTIIPVSERLINSLK